MDSLPVNVRDLIWKHVSGDSQSTAGAMSTTRNVGSRQEQSRLCLFPTSVAKLHENSKKCHATSFLNGHSYTFGCLDVGSLDLGLRKTIYTTRYTGAFRSEGVSGNGYFARELLEDISKFPHYLPTEKFKQLRDDLILNHAGNLVKLPKEIRLMIYEHCCMPSALPNLPTRCVVSEMAAHAAMLLNLQTTCSFLHEEISTHLYNHHVYYFNTPARLANFTRCLSFGSVPPPRNLGTIIIEIRIFEPLNGIDDPDYPVTVSSVSGNRDVVERDYSLCEPYENFKDLHMTNPHFVYVRDREREVTRNWVRTRHDVDWAMAIEGLVKHKVHKLVIKPELGGLAVLRCRGRFLRAIEIVGDSQMVDNVEIILEGEVGRDVPRQVARRVASLRRQYGWD